jgi:hypothetical protein
VSAFRIQNTRIENEEFSSQKAEAEIRKPKPETRNQKPET